MTKKTELHASGVFHRQTEKNIEKEKTEGERKFLAQEGRSGGWG